METLQAAPRYRDVQVGGCLSAVVSTGADGVVRLQSTEALGPYPARLTDRLLHWAEVAPDRVFAARRQADGQWRTIRYGEMLARSRSVAQALLQRGLGLDRPVAILSDNDLEHLTLSFGAMWAGVPFIPVSPAYSLVSQDHSRLRHILSVTAPGLVFASGPAYGRAIAAVVDPAVEVVLSQSTLEDRVVTPFGELLATPAGDAADQAQRRTGPDTIVKFLFTSGSTQLPKGVINTHRMLCSNQQMARQSFAFVADEPPVLVDWLPWNHTFGGNQNVGFALYNGGTLYIDEGKPTPNGIAETVRNLREISPTLYFNVPKGFEELVGAMDHDTVLRDNLFRRVRGFMFAGAGLSQAVWDRLHAHAERSIGERVRVFTGLGMTETSPSCLFALGADVRSGWVGLPCPGVDVKLVPMGDKTEVRFRGPHVTPGYWRAPDLTAKAFDDEGFYCTGDAVRFVDPHDPQRGLLFDGRVAEDFKLATGTFVSVGPLRARVILAGAPMVQDVVVAGLNRNEIGLLVFPRVDDCRRCAGLPAGSDLNEVMHHPAVRAFFQDLVDRLWREGTGSATRVARMHLLVEPPAIDKGEVTDKGSINQRAVLSHRAALVEAMYEDADPWMLKPRVG